MLPPSTLFTDRDSRVLSEVGEATTQTEDVQVFETSLTSEVVSSSCPSTDDDTSEADSVMDRLTRSVGRLFTMERRDRGTQTAKDPMTSETEKLAFDIVFFALGKRNSNSGDDVARCLRHSVTKMLDRHSIVFNGMMSRLKVDRNSDLKVGFNQLAEELFIGREVTWGKIVALFAFGARLAQHCSQNNLSDLVFDIATLLGQYAVDKLTPFLREHGGWATLLEVFPLESDYESTIWKSLLFTGFGLTAVATILALNR
jgi:hypothetical protein